MRIQVAGLGIYPTPSNPAHERSGIVDLSDRPSVVFEVSAVDSAMAERMPAVCALALCPLFCPIASRHGCIGSPAPPELSSSTALLLVIGETEGPFNWLVVLSARLV